MPSIRTAKRLFYVPHVAKRPGKRSVAKYIIYIHYNCVLIRDKTVRDKLMEIYV